MNADNPFAAPQSMGMRDAAPLVGGAPVDGTYWREGNLLVAKYGAELPPRCAKCNAPVDDYRKRFKLSWYHPIALVGLLLGFLPFLLIVLLTQKRLVVHASICQDHRRRRIWGILMGWGGVLLSIVLMIVAGSVAPRNVVGAAIPLAFVLMILSFIFMVVRSRVLWAKRIRKEQAWIKGCGPEFLSAIPEAITAELAS